MTLPGHIIWYRGRLLRRPLRRTYLRCSPYSG